MEEIQPQFDKNDTTRHGTGGNEADPDVQFPEVNVNMENMEIHHHPDLKHKKKYLKE
jgi:hypothetical protein